MRADAATPQPKTDANAIDAKKSKVDLRTRISFPPPKPSVIGPRTDMAPTQNNRDAATKPSVNLEEPSLENLALRRSPARSSRSSICIAVPSIPPTTMLARTIKTGQPAPRVSLSSGSVIEAQVRTAIIPVTNPSPSVTTSRIFSVSRCAIKTPKVEPINTAMMLITVPDPINMELLSHKATRY